MKIVFICGSLEPGKDGVGDYARRLACEIIRNGHIVSIIALNDRHLKEHFLNEWQTDNETEIATIRLSAKQSWKQRILLAKEFIEIQDPDWLSLQFVPFSFHNKGLPLRLATRLKKIGGKKQWHVMIHEPFITSNHSYKQKIVQRLQIKVLKSIFKSLRPKTHTSITHYQQLINKQTHVNTKILPLFGNIPIIKEPIRSNQSSTQNEFKTAVYFGSAPTISQLPIFITKLSEYYSKAEYKNGIKLVLCGNLGANGADFQQSLQATSADSGLKEIIVLGKLSQEQVSKTFIDADFGISRVPPRLIGKSGSTISMLEHGLPVWFPIIEGRDDSNLLSFRPELCFFDLQSLFGTTTQKGSPQSRLPPISATFLTELKN